MLIEIGLNYAPQRNDSKDESLDVLSNEDEDVISIEEFNYFILHCSV